MLDGFGFLHSIRFLRKLSKTRADSKEVNGLFPGFRLAEASANHNHDFARRSYCLTILSS